MRADIAQFTCWGLSLVFSCATMGTLPPTSNVPDSSTSQGAFAVSLDKQTASWSSSSAIAARVGAAVVEEPAALSVAGLGLSFARRLEERLILARGQRGAGVFLYERPLAAPFASTADLQGVGGSGTEHGAPPQMPFSQKGRDRSCALSLPRLSRHYGVALVPCDRPLAVARIACADRSIPSSRCLWGGRWPHTLANYLSRWQLAVATSHLVLRGIKDCKYRLRTHRSPLLSRTRTSFAQASIYL